MCNVHTGIVNKGISYCHENNILARKYPMQTNLASISNKNVPSENKRLVRVSEASNATHSIVIVCMSFNACFNELVHT